MLHTRQALNVSYYALNLDDLDLDDDFDVDDFVMPGFSEGEEDASFSESEEDASDFGY